MAEDSTTNPESSSGSPQGPQRSSGDASPDAAANAALKAAREAIAGLGDMGAVDDTTEDAGSAGTSAVSTPGPAPSAFSLPAFDVSLTPSQSRAIDLLSDVNLDVKIELGRTRMYIEDLLKLTDGSVVELDKLAGDPVDIYVNDRHVARGEVLVLNDSFCVRINEILAAPADIAKAA